MEPGVWTPVGEWCVCPFGLMSTPWWRSIVSLDAAAMVSPLAAWPDGFAASTVDAMLALRSARQRAEAAAAKRAAKG